MLETNTQSFTVFFICSLGVFPNKNVQCICSRWAMNSWILLCQWKNTFASYVVPNFWAHFNLVVLKKACFHMFVWNNVQTIGTIIWKHYPDNDHKRPGRTTKTTSIYPVDRDDRVNFEAIMHMETLSDDWDERDDRRLSLYRSWKSIVTIGHLH